MSIINGLRKLKSWEWILLFIFLVMVFLFRFKYMTVGTVGLGLLRINRITGIAKVYEWDYKLGKFKLYKEEKYTYKYKRSRSDMRSRSDIEKMLLNREEE